MIRKQELAKGFTGGFTKDSLRVHQGFTVSWGYPHFAGQYLLRINIRDLNDLNGMVEIS